MATPLFGASSDEDYKALVCVLLEGGADTLDMVLPKYHAAAHAAYQKVRPGIAQPRQTIRPLLGSRHGFHSAMPHLQKLYNLKNLAVVANVGTLIKPVTKYEILRGTAKLPPQLFQRVAQRDQAMMAGGEESGWAARVGDQLGKPLTNISVGGLNRMQYGATHPALIAHDEHYGVMDDPTRIMERLDRIDIGVQANKGHTKTLAEQLEIVASLMAARRSAHLPGRQIYFVRDTGWEVAGLSTEEAVTQNRANIAELDQALGAFGKALDGLGLSEKVTTFTTTDLSTGMQFPQGADQGWGGHLFAFGGAVRGGMYGTMPRIELGSPDALDDGALIPTTSTDQYLATLVGWLGDGRIDLHGVFPRLKNFKQETLGFMSA
jgi:uncharacterized protein (DUF1501 family)